MARSGNSGSTFPCQPVGLGPGKSGCQEHWYCAPRFAPNDCSFCDHEVCHRLAGWPKAQSPKSSGCSRRKRGVNQRRDPGGDESNTMPQQHAKHANNEPISHFVRWASLKFGRPSGWSLSRTGRGPGRPECRAREWVLQSGIARIMSHQSEPHSQMSLSWSGVREASYCGP